MKADGNYGKIDNLHISYDDNRITTVLEDAFFRYRKIMLICHVFMIGAYWT